MEIQFQSYICSIFAALSLLICSTYCLSTFRFRRSQRHNATNGRREAPLVPYCIPGLFHALGFLCPAAFLATLTKRFGSETPLLTKAGNRNIFIFANPKHVNVVFRKSKQMTNKLSTLFALRRLMDLPSEAVEFYRADDSGMGQKPRQESNVAPEHRINFLISNNLKQHLSPHLVNNLGHRYTKVLQTRLEQFGIAEDWVLLPDLFTFIQKVVNISTVEMLCGPHLQRLCPDLIDDLPVFQSHVPNFLQLYPRWLMRSAYRARHRLIQGIKRWHAFALEHCDCENVGPDDADWEPYFGAKICRIRQQYSLKLTQMTPDARASEDLGLIFASTNNALVSIFWMTLHSVQDTKLRSHLLNEISSCRLQDSHSFDMVNLKEKPLIQSTYAEVLRLYVAGASSRLAEYEDITVDGYTIPKDSYLVMYGRTMALDHELWTKAGRTLRKPLEEFDAERFLVDAGWSRLHLTGSKSAPPEPLKDDHSSERRFTMEGLMGIWMPYGGGDHMCPGRHLAKYQIIATFATLLSKFDVELVGEDASNVKPSMRYAPFGALPPACDTPFRIRKRISGQTKAVEE